MPDAPLPFDCVAVTDSRTNFVEFGGGTDACYSVPTRAEEFC
jgi:hypothetical protein